MATRAQTGDPAGIPPGRRRAGRALQLLLVAASGVLVLGAGALAARDLGLTGGGDPERARPRPAIALSGQVEDLFPGERAELEVRAVNTTRRPLRLRLLSASARDASASCPASAIAITRTRAKTKLPPRGSATVRLAATLAAAAPDACKGATWPLRFRARARRASIAR